MITRFTEKWQNGVLITTEDLADSITLAQAKQLALAYIKGADGLASKKILTSFPFYAQNTAQQRLMKLIRIRMSRAYTLSEQNEVATLDKNTNWIDLVRAASRTIATEIKTATTPHQVMDIDLDNHIAWPEEFSIWLASQA